MPENDELEHKEVSVDAVLGMNNTTLFFLGESGKQAKLSIIWIEISVEKNKCK